MPKQYREVDFLVVTALPVETEAVRALLEDVKPFGNDLLGRVTREHSKEEYSVALTEIGAMGTDAAQAAAKDAIVSTNPKWVILTGIAAGFPESGVNLGDLLVPYYIVDYELAKIRERPVGFLQTIKAIFKSPAETERVEYEHRAKIMPVSHPLWRTARALARNGATSWNDRIPEKRPDNKTGPPPVHSESSSVLGCGKKLVASELAEARKWLLSQYKKDAIGLEMESIGVLTACRSEDKPFLLVKGAQDPATATKDEPGKKDQWRRYAAEAAAAFVIELIQRFAAHTSVLVGDHMRDCNRLAPLFREGPRPTFPVTVSRAESYSQLRAEIYDHPHQNPTSLIPNDDTPAVALHGGGGTGKSRILKWIFATVLDDGYCPVLVDLKEYARNPANQIHSDDDLLEQILIVGTRPRRSVQELEKLAQERGLVVIIDGLNEVSRQVRTTLIAFFQKLNKDGSKCYQLVSDRFGASDSIDHFSHWAADRLDSEAVAKIFAENPTFGPDYYAQLLPRLQRIFRRPFFLALALRTGKKFTGSGIWSSIFAQFFTEQVRLAPDDLKRVAKATVETADSEGHFDANKFGEFVGDETHQVLIAAEVLAKDGRGFEHDLWRDFLLSRGLADMDKVNWRNATFDIVTNFSYSLECLPLTVEQLPDGTRKDEFLKAVFNWNYSAAADSIVDFRDDDPEPRRLSIDIRTAILAAIAEKRFDRVQRTRRRASELLGRHRYDFATAFRDLDWDDLVRHVSNINGTEEWFAQWQLLFVKREGDNLTQADLDCTASEDSLFGWSAANAARRGRLTSDQQGELRARYQADRNDVRRAAARWRIMHILGRYSTAENADCLIGALNTDAYHWVRYGAARGLIEIAADAQDSLRKRVLDELFRFAQTYNPPDQLMRRQILDEILECSFIRRPTLGWKPATLPLLEAIVNRETESEQKDRLKRRFEAFPLYDETA